MPRTSDHWSNYWAQGQMTSLPQDFRANYDGEIATFWREQFEGVGAEGCVLDLCTGNGAVALLAAEFAEGSGKSLAITAVDAARIDPRSMAARHPLEAGRIGSIRFVGEQPLESLDPESPLWPDAGFDLICSQYGIEYCDWRGSAAQVARLLRPGGRFAMVNHAPSSDILRTMEAEAAEYALLDELQVEPAIRRYLNGRGDPAALRSTLESAAGHLEQRMREQPSALYRFVLGVLGEVVAMNARTLRAQRDNLRRFHSDLCNGRDRLEDMLRVNAAIAAEPEWHRVFIEAGLEHQDCGELYYRGRHRAGRYHRFRRTEA